MKIIGLTGQSGSGKTTVCGYFENLGFKIIDCDQIARLVTQKDHPCLLELTSCFGTMILDDFENLKRKRLGEIAFSDTEKLTMLNTITHRYITIEIAKLLRKFESENSRFVILDAPTLFESGVDSICDVVISVVADEGVRIERMRMRDGLDDEMIRLRLKAQHENLWYTTKSDYVIENNGEDTDLLMQIYDITKKLENPT